MKNLITYSALLVLLVFSACNQKSADNNGETATVSTVDSSDIYNSSDLKNLALAINATDKDALQQAIDAIKNMDVKYWAIAVTVKTDNGLVEAVQKTQNADIKYAAFAMSGNDTTQTQQVLEKVNEADLRNVATAYLYPAQATASIDQIKNARLKNLALSITSASPEDKVKYANAIGE
ncbi:MAG TPA: hypothetical protein VK154_13065 [Chitinophagales bacterium]|nr:hypothetical protein [Chitinophagales bacterium]